MWDSVNNYSFQAPSVVQGKAILLVSVELEEILSLADRVAVMFDGMIMGERSVDQTDEKELGLLMAGVAGEAA